MPGFDLEFGRVVLHTTSKINIGKLFLPALAASSQVAILGVFKDMLKKDVIVAA